MHGGGAERQLVYLATELVRLEWEVHVAVMHRGTNWPRLEASGTTIHEVPAKSSYDPRVFVQLRRILREVDPDIVQVWLLQMEILGGLAAISTRTPWVFSERASKDAYPLSVKTLGRRAVAQWATALVSNSTEGDTYWAPRLRRRIRRYVIPNGLPLGEIAETRPARPEEVVIGPDESLVLFAGRLDPQKNVDTLLSAVKLVDVRRQVRVLCCGDGSLRAHLERRIATEGLRDRVRLVGFTKDLWPLMKRATVFVSPSWFEGSPNVVLEAMACGVPLIVSNIDSHRALLDETSAVLVDPRSADQLARAIENVLENPVEAAARSQVASVRIAQFGMNAIARQYSDLYQEILSGKARS